MGLECQSGQMLALSCLLHWHESAMVQSPRSLHHLLGVSHVSVPEVPAPPAVLATLQSTVIRLKCTCAQMCES